MAATNSTTKASTEPYSPPTGPTGNTLTDSTAAFKQKRARSQLSCTPCRIGKLKCDRQKPACDQCIKRSRDSTCTYLPPPTKNKPTQNVKGRIRQLEHLVMDLMNQNRTTASAGETRLQYQTNVHPARTGKEAGARQQSIGPYSQPTPPSDSDTSPRPADSNESSSPLDEADATTSPFGQMRISKNEISYVGEGNWDAILSSISDLKRELEEIESNDSEQPDQLERSCESVPKVGMPSGSTPGLGFTLGNSNPVTKEQLLAAVPEKKVVDRLLSLWFNSADPFKPALHAPTFQNEYRQFWRTKDAPTMWLGLLFAIMSVAASYPLRDNDPDSPQAQVYLAEVAKYHGLAASAAVLADFTRPKQYTIECLVMYAAGLRSNNTFINGWLMLGLIIRLALRMGYHRDASHYPAITVYEGEMRRRVWAVISMIDVLISFQLGLPSMVKAIQTDTQAPRNLLDRDFNPSSTSLPPSRGIDELTPSSYTRVKLGLVKIFAQAAELSHATVPPAQEEIIRLDRELEEAKKQIPPLLQTPDISELVTDPAQQLMSRFNIDLLYLKTKMTLHRRFMLTSGAQLSLEEQQRGIGRSRSVCIECALRVLQHHHTIYTASQPGGQLESVRWYMGTISTHDFLLAAMIICLELSAQINNTSLQESANSVQYSRQKEMMAALERSQRIWSDAGGRRKVSASFSGSALHGKGEHMLTETDKASRAMAVMLKKVKKQVCRHAVAGHSAMSAAGMESIPASVGLDKTYSADGTFDKISKRQGISAASSASMGSDLDWIELAAVPELNPGGLATGGAPFLDSGSAGMNGMTCQALLPHNDILGHPRLDSLDTSSDEDFSAISNMLDVSDPDLDWQMWDNEITQEQTVSINLWPDLQADSLDVSWMPDMTSASIGDGNTLNGSSGIDLATALRNGSLSSDGFDLTQMDPMEFDMNAPLQPVNFDFGVDDGNQTNMYPATAAEWEDFHRGKITTPK